MILRYSTKAIERPAKVLQPNERLWLGAAIRLAFAMATTEKPFIHIESRSWRNISIDGDTRKATQGYWICYEHPNHRVDHSPRLATSWEAIEWLKARDEAALMGLWNVSIAPSMDKLATVLEIEMGGKWC